MSTFQETRSSLHDSGIRQFQSRLVRGVASKSIDFFLSFLVKGAAMGICAITILIGCVCGVVKGKEDGKKTKKKEKRGLICFGKATDRKSDCLFLNAEPT